MVVGHFGDRGPQDANTLWVPVRRLGTCSPLELLRWHGCRRLRTTDCGTAALRRQRECPPARTLSHLALAVVCCRVSLGDTCYMEWVDWEWLNSSSWYALTLDRSSSSIYVPAHCMASHFFSRNSCGDVQRSRKDTCVNLTNRNDA